jgi:tetratricopeptide (TPR) repeat protein
MLQSGASNNAVTYLNQSLAIDPKSSQTYFILGAVYEAIKEYAKAEINFRKSIELYPEYTEAYYGLSKTCFDQKKIEESKLNLNKCLSLNPSYQPAKQLQEQLIRLTNNP